MDRDEVGLRQERFELHALGAGLGFDVGGELERVGVDHVASRSPSRAGPPPARSGRTRRCRSSCGARPGPASSADPRSRAAPRAGSVRPSPRRRAAAISSANAVSAVVSVSTSGVLVASTPAAVHAATSMLSKPTAWLATIVRLRPGRGQELGVDLLGEHRDDGVAAGDHLEELVPRDAELVLVDRDVGSVRAGVAVAPSMIGRVTRMFGRSLMRRILPCAWRARSMDRTAGGAVTASRDHGI